MNMVSALFSSILGAVVGSGATYFVVNERLNNLSEEIKLRPPVLVVDQLKLASDVGATASEDELKVFLKRTNVALSKFREAGFLILSREFIVSSPEDVNLTVDDVNSTKDG